MGIRFLILWVLLAAVSYGLIYVATKSDRKTMAKQWRRIVFSLLVSAAIIIPLFLINNISGV